MIQEALKEQQATSPNEVTMHSVAPPKEPEKLFPTGEIDVIRKWMGQVNDIIREMESRKFIGTPSLGGGLSPNSHMTKNYAIGLLAALRHALQSAKIQQNHEKMRRKKI